MIVALWILLACGIAVLAVGVAWRWGSRFLHLPCPARFAWVLENDFMERRGGSAAVVERLRLESGMRVADVGCGPGRLTLPIAERVGPTGEVVALDLQPRMLERVQRRMRARNIANIRTLLGGAGEGMLPVDYFDRAILVTVLGEIPDRLRAVKEIYSALRPGGFLSVTEILPDPHYQRIATVKRLAETAGLQIGDTISSLFSYTIHLYRPDDSSAKVT